MLSNTAVLTHGLSPLPVLVAGCYADGCYGVEHLYRVSLELAEYYGIVGSFMTLELDNEPHYNHEDRLAALQPYVADGCYIADEDGDLMVLELETDSVLENPYFDRFDVCRAYQLYLAGWNRDGLTPRCHFVNTLRGCNDRGIGVTLARLGYRAGYGVVSPNALLIYTRIILVYEGIYQYRTFCTDLGIPSAF